MRGESNVSENALKKMSAVHLMMKKTCLRDDTGYQTVYDVYSAFPSRYHMMVPKVPAHACGLGVPTLSCKQARPPAKSIPVETRLYWAEQTRFDNLEAKKTLAGLASTLKSRPQIRLQSSEEAQYKARGSLTKITVDTELRYPNLTAHKQRGRLLEEPRSRLDLIDPVLKVEPWPRGGVTSRDTSYDEV